MLEDQKGFIENILHNTHSVIVNEKKAYVFEQAKNRHFHLENLRSSKNCGDVLGRFHEEIYFCVGLHIHFLFRNEWVNG